LLGGRKLRTVVAAREQMPVGVRGHLDGSVPEPGDGQVFRVVAEVQRRFYDAPIAVDNDGDERRPRDAKWATW
jgi:hypothetical protein